MASKTIVLKGQGVRKEHLAAGTITPCHLIALNGSSRVGGYATAGGNAAVMVAIEEDHIGHDIDDDYSSGDLVMYEHLPPGAEWQAILTTSQTVVQGDFLESAGNGRLRKHTPPVMDSTPDPATPGGGSTLYSKGIVAQALEAVTTTAAVARIKVQVV